MLLSFLIWGHFVPKFSKNVNDAIRLLKYGSPLSLLILGVIIYLGPNTESIHWALFIVSAVFLSLIQPAVGMAFSLSNAGKALTSYNLLIFWFIFQFLNLSNIESSIAWMAHIGGFIFGYIFSIWQREPAPASVPDTSCPTTEHPRSTPPVERERPVRPCRPTSIRLPAPARRGSGCARWFPPATGPCAATRRDPLRETATAKRARHPVRRTRTSVRRGRRSPPAPVD